MHPLKILLESLGKAHLLHSKKSLTFLLLYFLLGAAVFSACAFVGFKYQHDIYQAVLNYLFPTSWHRAANIIVDFFFDSQSKIVVAGLLSSSSLVLASILLFPIKEKCSAEYEKALGLPNGEITELPLWVQGLEESKLLLIYITSQMVILAIGYYPYIATQIIAQILSILFLAFTFGIDFIGPTFQRHSIKYNAVIRLLLKRGISTLLWGAVFALPVLYIGHYLLSQENLTLVEISAAIFGTNLIFLSLAVVSGTYLASTQISSAQKIPLLANRLRITAYAAMATVFCAGLIFHGSLFLSVHRKTQALKMDYSIDWKNANIEMDSLLTLLREQGEISIQFPLHVNNPTPYDFELENSFIILKQEDRQVARMAISYLYVPAGGDTTQQMNVGIHVSGKSLSSLRHLMSGWSGYLEYNVLPSIPIVVKII